MTAFPRDRFRQAVFNWAAQDTKGCREGVFTDAQGRFLGLVQSWYVRGARVAERYLPPMEALFPLLREALWQLSLEPREQRAALAGTVVTDELTLDLRNAMESLPYACEVAGISLDMGVLASLERLTRLLDAEPGDELWGDEALDKHPAWAEARGVAREVLPLIPSDA
ncbi:MAG: hypothetical protein JHC71_08770 [Blastococcus sp.]|nr:hypothetical protein [Blastococcus sp.]